MWTYEEATACSLDPVYIQNLETRVGTLVASCTGDQCPLMPRQCTDGYCIPLTEYVRQLQEVNQMFDFQQQPQQQQGGYQQGGYPQQQGGGYPQQGGY